MGSLTALEMSGASRFWKRRLGYPMPSAETMGVMHSKMDADTLREGIRQFYGCLKRNQALPDNRGVSVAIVDGHESYRRHCSGCLERPFIPNMETAFSITTVLLLVTGAPPGSQPLRIPLDHEP